MNPHLSIRAPRHPGSALIIFLALLTLITVLCVSLFVTIGTERSSAGLAREVAQAGALADLAADVALARLDAAIDAGRQLGAHEITTWASEPGRIHVYTIAQSNGSFTREEHPLYSAPIGADDAAHPELHHVDLNKPNIAGVHPITGSQPATMRIGWNLVPTTPGTAPSASNPPLGRIAWWVDDESCKVNINVADGSRKGDLYRELGAEETSGSFGFGTPTEISLQALKTSAAGTTELTQAQAAAIADYGWEHGFNTLGELQRAPNIPTGFADANRFNLTTLNRSPDETFFHEPRIPLIPMGSNRNRTLVLGPTHSFKAFSNNLHYGPVQFLYPLPNQLPTIDADGTLLPRLPEDPNLQSNNHAISKDRPYLSRIARAISGRGADGAPFPWPAFPGTSGGFASKYNARQIDSIALQIYDMSHRNAFVDAVGAMHNSIPSFAINGIINPDETQPRSVIGIGRTFSLTEVAVLATVSNASKDKGGTTYQMPKLQLEVIFETHLPAGFAGAPLHGQYAKAHLQQWSLSAFRDSNNFNFKGLLNQQDANYAQGTLKTHWQDLLLRIDSPEGQHAGFDLAGHTISQVDPDQTKAELLHPYADQNEQSNWMGTLSPGADEPRRVLKFLSPYGATSGAHWENHDIDSQNRSPGAYLSLRNQFGSAAHNGKPWNPAQFLADTGQPLDLHFKGGIQFLAQTSNYTLFWEATPLPFLTYLRSNNTDLAANQAAVIPVDFKITINEAGAGQAAYHLTTADPWVNKFPGDWTGTLDPPAAETTLQIGNPRTSYRRGGAASIADTYFRLNAGTQIPNPQNFDGDNPQFSPSGGGDPLSLWLPRTDPRYPKQSRFPSIGALNFIRTGMIPDNLSLPVERQRGVPFRSINFSASSAESQRVNNVRYPDWAMLDLFMVPFIPQKIYHDGEPAQAPRLLTYGGATQGRLNLNNPRIPHPFENEPTPPVRTAPLEALFRGIRISNQYDADNEPVFTTVDHAALRAGVQTYLAANGPFLLPGQLAEVPEIDAAAFTSSRTARARASRSRNDLLRQVVGATTTQSNTFSIWVVAQTFRKSKGNTQYDQFEPGDIVTGEVRRRYLVERFVETGTDGVPGNAEDPGPDGLIGTADDPVHPELHPAMTYPLPYRWRITLVEELS